MCRSVFILDEAGRTNKQRSECLHKWFNNGGVMCMGYKLYLLYRYKSTNTDAGGGTQV